MKFKEFEKRVVENIKSYLPGRYADAELEVTTVNKINRSYTALIVRVPEIEAAPSINLEECYKHLESGTDFEMVMRNIAAQAQMEPEGFDGSLITDYSTIKDRLYIRVSDPEHNAEVLKNAPHKIISGLAVTYHILIGTDAEGTMSTMVTNHLMDEYGVTAEQLHEDAVKSSMELLPPKIAPLESVMAQLLGMDCGESKGQTFDEALAEMSAEDAQMILLSNSRGVNGAAVLFYPDVLDKIGTRFRKNFFILPSSVHEVLLVPENGAMNAADLGEMVRSINAAEVSPEDRLSDNVFRYCAETKCFDLAG